MTNPSLDDATYEAAYEREMERWVEERAQQIITSATELSSLLDDYHECYSRLAIGLVILMNILERGIDTKYAAQYLRDDLLAYARKRAEDEWERDEHWAKYLEAQRDAETDAQVSARLCDREEP